jgi:hypothetical protein
MAPRRPQVFADTNVLVSAPLRDLLIAFALDDLIGLFWSPQVMAELERVLLQRPGVVPARVGSMLQAMNAALPAASVTPPTGFVIRAQLPDPADTPILRDALAARCDILLTFNLRDFPAGQIRLDSDSLAPVHPDAFVVHMLTAHAPAVVPIVKRILGTLTRPPMPWKRTRPTSPVQPCRQRRRCCGRCLSRSALLVARALDRAESRARAAGRIPRPDAAAVGEMLGSRYPRRRRGAAAEVWP